MMFSAKMLALLALLPYQGLALPTASGGEGLIPIPDHLAPEISTGDVDGDVSSGDGISEMLARGRPVWKDYECVKYVYAGGIVNRNIVTQGVKELRTWKGIPIVPPRECKKMWGTNGSIYLCNNNYSELRLSGYLDVADGAQQLLDKCPLMEGNGIEFPFMKGRQHAEGNWFVLVQA